MYIVNQTETVAVNIDNVCKIEVVDNCIVSVAEGDQIILGRYESDERAREVFDKILSIQGKEIEIRYMPD